MESEKCSEIGGNLKQRGNASLPLGDERSCVPVGLPWADREHSEGGIFCRLGVV